MTSHHSMTSYLSYRPWIVCSWPRIVNCVECLHRLPSDSSLPSTYYSCQWCSSHLHDLHDLIPPPSTPTPPPRSASSKYPSIMTWRDVSVPHQQTSYIEEYLWLPFVWLADSVVSYRSPDSGICRTGSRWGRTWRRVDGRVGTDDGDGGETTEGGAMCRQRHCRARGASRQLTNIVSCIPRMFCDLPPVVSVSQRAIGLMN